MAVLADKLPKGYRPESLPKPADYFRKVGVTLTKPKRGKWARVPCPFHRSVINSLAINIEVGAFRCRTCGRHGGDVLSFHRQFRGLGFVEAAKALGAWSYSEAVDRSDGAGGVHVLRAGHSGHGGPAVAAAARLSMGS